MQELPYFDVPPGEKSLQLLDSADKQVLKAHRLEYYLLCVACVACMGWAIWAEVRVERAQQRLLAVHTERSAAYIIENKVDGFVLHELSPSELGRAVIEPATLISDATDFIKRWERYVPESRDATTENMGWLGARATDPVLDEYIREANRRLDTYHMTPTRAVVNSITRRDAQSFDVLYQVVPTQGEDRKPIATWRAELRYTHNKVNGNVAPFVLEGELYGRYLQFPNPTGFMVTDFVKDRVALTGISQ